MGATFYVGDAIEVMNSLPEKSVDLVISSPPFLALRSYLPSDHPDKALEGGSQSTPGEYIDWLLDVVEACARVLAPHGSLVFELGDTYSGSGGAGGDYATDGLREGQPPFNGSGKLARYSDDRGNPDGMRDTTFSGGNTRTGGGNGWPLAKSLSLIPESFRWAMVYGRNPFTGRPTEPWRLRNVIRWVRPNPPVGALGDKFRPATSELMVFCKAKDRYFDLDAVREPYKFPDHPQIGKNPNGTKGYDKNELMGSGRQIRTEHPAGAPPLDWWNIPPGGFSGSHYAVWPPELLIKPIKAMCPEKVCRTCGEASRRIVGEAEYVNSKTGKPVTTLHFSGERRQDGENHWNTEGAGDRAATRVAPTLGFSDCGHDDFRPGLVLDCFGGSGTTALVATGHGRDCILIDLDARNYELALDRVGPFILSRAS